MTKVLVIVVFICLIFSVLSIVVTPGKDDDKKAAIFAAEETDDDDEETDDEDEEPVVSSLSFSTSAALSSDDYIAPDIIGGRIPVDCVEGLWEDVPGASCDQSTGKIQQRKYITPARSGGTCGVEPDPENYIYQDRDCEESCTRDTNWSPAACPTGCLWDGGRTATSITQTKGQTSKKYVSGAGSKCYGVESKERKQIKQCPETETCKAAKVREATRRAEAAKAAKAEADAAVAEARTGSCQGQVRGLGDDAENARICGGLRKSKCTSALFPPYKGLPYHWYCTWVEH
jgi:hypothetical protein